MKTSPLFTKNLSQRRLVAALCACASLVAAQSLVAADKITTAPEETETQNWVTFSLGGLILHGDHGQAAQQLRMSDNLIGGIENMHWEQSLSKDTTLKIDGHALVGNFDYLAKMILEKTNVGYFTAGYSTYRTYYDGNGGYFPYNGAFYPPQAGNVQGIDRAKIFAEIGLRMPDLPEVTLRYERDTRHGDKDSTIWGDTAATGLPGAPSSGNGYNVRKIVPAFRDINEVTDTFSLDVKHTIGKTDVAIGGLFEHISNADSLNTLIVSTNGRSGANNVPQYLTQGDSTSGDLFSVHGSTVTRFNDKFWMSFGYDYTTDNTDTSGSRIIGAGWNSPLNSGYRPGATVTGFYNQLGGSEVGDNTAAMSLMYTPIKDLTLVASARFEQERINSNSSWIGTSLATSGTYTFTQYMGNSINNTNRVAESLEARYTGLADWVLYTRGSWTEESGTVNENGSPATTPVLFGKDIDRLAQKYEAGANWYPCSMANLSLQYYYQTDQYKYVYSGTSGTIAGQNFMTNDVNVRLTVRPLNGLTLVTRYDFQQLTIDSQDEGAGPGTSGRTPSNIFSESITWTPIDRLYVQGIFSYVLSKTDTSSTLVNGVNSLPVNFSNNYWTLTAGAGYAIDEKTDVRADYTCYKANNFDNFALVAQPYGVGVSEHTVMLGITRQIRRNMTMNVKAGYFKYTDKTSGDHNNFDGALVSTGLTVRF